MLQVASIMPATKSKKESPWTLTLTHVLETPADLAAGDSRLSSPFAERLTLATPSAEESEICDL
jgi:hypothetical protein